MNNGILHALVQGAAKALPSQTRCGCHECLRARGTGAAFGPCPRAIAGLRTHVARRLRAGRPSGAAELARLSSQVHRWATAWSAAAESALAAFDDRGAQEAPLESFLPPYLS